MKKRILQSICIISIVSMSSIVLACEGSECFQSADGNAGEYTYFEHGDSMNGGWTEGASNGNYLAEGVDAADGSANTYGKSSGESTPGEVWSKNRVESDAWGSVNIQATVNVDGESTQSNWATQDESNGNYSTGGNNSNAGYTGADSTGCNPCETESTIEGLAVTYGKTTTEVDLGTDTNYSAAKSNNYGQAEQTGTGETWTNGNGGISTGAYKEVDSSWAGAQSNGSFCYEGQDPSSIYMSGFSEGNSSGTVTSTPNEITASSNAYSQSKVD
jgi:hypothetical protein